MRRLILSAVIVMAGLLPAAQAGADSAVFDGSWDVIALCPATTAGVAGYTLEFPAQVKAGVLHGVYGTEGKSSSMTLDGTIQPDGSAKFAAKGLTGDSIFSGGTSSPRRPTPTT